MIDIGAFFDGDTAVRGAVARQIGDACESIGFFAIDGHGVDPSLLDDAFRVGAEFYDQPQAEKDRWRPAQSSAARGYHRLGTKNLAKTLGRTTPPDLREQFYIGPLEDWAARYSAYPEAAFLYAQNIWPTAPAAYQPVFTRLYGSLESLAFNLMRLFAIALDIAPEFFADKIDRHFSTLPLNDYPALDYAPLPDQLRCGEHTDFGSLTVLAIGPGQSGLQVKTRDAGWTDVAVEHGQFVVNIGDMMQRWTDDRWVSTLHRVVNPPQLGAEYRRQSMGFFLHPNFDTVIDPLASCAGPGAGEKYPPVLAGRLMADKLRARAS